MATTNKTARKAQTTKAATTKASKAKASPETAAEDEASAAAAEKEAEEAARNSALIDIRGKLSDALDHLTKADKDNAIEARLTWVKIGQTLIEGRSLFMVGNNSNDVEFGRWIAAQNFNALTRPSRAAAIWLAETHDQNPSLYSKLPTESINGEPLRRSPRTLRDWVKEQLHEAFQIAFDANSDSISVPSDADKADRPEIAKTNLANVYQSLDDAIDNAQANMEAAQTAISAAKGKEARDKATADYSAKADTLDHYERIKGIMDDHSDEERLNAFISWKPKRPTIAFRDCDVQTAAERVFNLLKSHEQFAEVYEALGLLVEAQKAAVEAEAEAAEEDEDFEPGDEDEAEDDFDFDADEAEDGDEDEVDFDADDEDEDEDE